MRVIGLASVGVAAGAIHKHTTHHEHISAMQVHTTAAWRRDCGKKVSKRYSMAQVSNPGAGMDPDSIEPFEKVLKDGFFMVSCVKDAMYVAGDKFGAGKHDYKMGAVSNSSIVHYDAHVAKEDREEMTHQVCFEFCRSVPDMGYFGFSNGRDCYCTPYFKPMAGGSSKCDAVCPGNNGQMCGGKSKQSIFGMHSCANTEEELSTADEEASEARSSLKSLAEDMKETVEDGEADANAWQEALGGAGDPTAAALMQSAKVWSGKVIKAADDALEAAGTVKESLDEVSSMAGKDFTEYDNAKAAEDLIKALNKGSQKLSELEEDLTDMDEKLEPAADDVDDASKQYYSLMYFVDKEHEDVPSTCGGETLGEPMMGQSMDACAAACDARPGKCVGFSYFEKDSSLCFLFSKFESVQYWTGCDAAAFLQKKKSSGTATCRGKLQSFEGLSLKPKANGKCDICLKEATKADRCW